MTAISFIVASDVDPLSGAAALHDISTVKTVDSPAGREIYVRIGAIGVMAVGVSLAFDLPWMLPWFGLFVAGVAGHTLLVRALPMRVGRAGLLLLLLSVLLRHGLFGVGVFYLWIQPEPMLQAIASVAVCLTLLYVQNAGRVAALTAFGAATAAAFGIVAMGAWQISVRADPAGGMVLLAMLGLLFIYSVFGVFEAAHTRRQFDAALAASAQLEKAAAMGRLTGGVAHDFNNMLTAILGNIDLLAETTDAGERAVIVAEAQMAARHAAGIVSQLLAFSRRTRPETRPVAPEAVVEAILVLLARLLPPGISIEADIPPGLPKVRSDESRLRSVVLNLCINARDAMDGRGRITLGLERRVVGRAAVRRSDGWLAPGAYIALCVTDEGPGISATLRDRVFDPFFTTKAAGEGSGLGLSMARSFLEQSGGAIGLETPSDGGLCVVVWLPTA